MVERGRLSILRIFIEIFKNYDTHTHTHNGKLIYNFNPTQFIQQFLAIFY